jgi:polysaccharide biosynthesis transport protein
MGGLACPVTLEEPVTLEVEEGNPLTPAQQTIVNQAIVNKVAMRLFAQCGSPKNRFTRSGLFVSRSMPEEWKYVSPNKLSIAGILPVLLCRKLLILLSGMILAGVAFGTSKTLPMSYTSEGSLIVDSRGITGSDGQSALNTGNDVLTAVDVLQSNGLIRRSIQQFDLANMPGVIAKMRLPRSVAHFLEIARQSIFDWWHRLNYNTLPRDKVDKLFVYVRKHLDVAVGSGSKNPNDSDKHSNLISIKFTAGSPKAAASVVNALVSTYLAGLNQARNEQTARVDKWIEEQTKKYQSSVLASEQQVTQFTEQHNMAEVQGSLTPALQLSHDLDQFVVLRQELARQQAALAAVGKGASAVPAAHESLESKTVQLLRELQAHLIVQVSYLPPHDPRRGPLQSELSGILSMINEQDRLIVASLGQAVQVTQARVKALETAIQEETVKAQQSAVQNAMLKQLVSDLDMRRQVYMTFLTQADRARLAAGQDAAAHVWFPATPPLRPDHSVGALALVLGFLGGCLAASGTLIARAYFDYRINSADEMELATGLPVFGTLPDFKRAGRDIMALPMVTETFRAMWVAMRSPQNDQGGIAIVVTSSDSEEGKTTVAVTLAARFAADGFRVLLIDADLRRPRLAKLLKLTADCSLEAAAVNSALLEKALVPLANGIDCLLSSGRESNPVKVLSSEKFAQLVAVCRRRYDFVILDSPPAMRVTDPILLAKLVQHIVFIAQAGRTPNALASKATQRFPEEDRAKMLALLTRVRESDKRFGYSGYGHWA